MPDLNGFRLSLKFSSTGAIVLCFHSQTGQATGLEYRNEHSQYQISVLDTNI